MIHNSIATKITEHYRAALTLFLLRTFVHCPLACHPLYYQDGNMGLVKQAASALTKRKILQLTHTYITLPLSGKADIREYTLFAQLGDTS